MDIKDLESERERLQIFLDSKRTKIERNKLGQYSTPKVLADDIVHTSLEYITKSNIRFLDTSIGTGVFYSSLIESVEEKNISCACGYEIDDCYYAPSKKLWDNTKLKYIKNNFLDVTHPIFDGEKYNLIISNPPYVRHHHIEENLKRALHDKIEINFGLSFSGLSGLYCYFIALSSLWLMKNGISTWLIPNEILDVNYGRCVKSFLINNVNLLRIHKYLPNNPKFSDALVTSIVLFYTMGTYNNELVLTMGDDLCKPIFYKSIEKSQLNPNEKWSVLFNNNHKKIISKKNLGDYFTVKRGIATGSNKHFILKENQIKELNVPKEYILPLLPSARYINEDICTINKTNTDIRYNYLLNVTCPEDRMSYLPKELVNYLNDTYSQIKNNYIIKNRMPWYKQESRSNCPFLLTYMGRNRKKPFRLFLNLTKAIVTNGYLMIYPKFDWETIYNENNDFLEMLYNDLIRLLNKNIVHYGRVYGGGLYKIEPKELMNIPVDNIFSNDVISLIQYVNIEYKQLTLFERPKNKYLNNEIIYN
jgi:hypothetical protein